MKFFANMQDMLLAKLPDIDSSPKNRISGSRLLNPQFMFIVSFDKEDEF